MKKVLYTIGLALLAVGCTEDYKDWANPFKNDPEAAKTMTMTINPVATIDLATVTADTIQIFSPEITIEDEAKTTYQAVMYGPEGDDSKQSLMLTPKVMFQRPLLKQPCMLFTDNVLFCVPFRWIYLAMSK